MTTYVDTGDVHTYYEVIGTGEPVVLLHGGLSTLDHLANVAAALAKSYQVFQPERRGHGRTPDVDGPITYENMAADTAAFMDALDIGPARVIGFSDGGNVALQLTLDRPDLVARLVVMGAPAGREGFTPEQIELFDRWYGQPYPTVMEQFRQQYGTVSPDGIDHFQVVFDKVGEMWQTARSIGFDELATIGAPTLVLLADDDCVTVEHAAAMARALPDAQLAVVPGTSHALPFEKPELVGRLILDFLAPVQVPRLMSLKALLDGGHP